MIIVYILPEPRLCVESDSCMLGPSTAIQHPRHHIKQHQSTQIFCKLLWPLKNKGLFFGPDEPLEKEINEILGSKREDRLSDPFFELVQNTTLVRFSYLLRLCNFCKAPRDM